MTPKVVKKRNRALDAAASLRAQGATHATFHPDGSVASVTFGPPVPAPPPQAPPSVVDEVLARPYPKTDLDVLDDLPSYDEGSN